MWPATWTNQWRGGSKPLIEPPLVVDANLLFSALLRDVATRRLILELDRPLYAPAWLWEEAASRREFLLKKSLLAPAVFEAVWAAFQDRIESVSEAMMAIHATEARKRCKRSGSKDAPYVACTLAVHGILWTHDATLRLEAGVPIITTAELL